MTDVSILQSCVVQAQLASIMMPVLTLNTMAAECHSILT